MIRLDPSARLFLIVASLVLFASGCERQREHLVPTESEESESVSPQAGHPLVSISQSGDYSVSVWPEEGAIPLGALHRWWVRVEDETGEPVERNLTLSVEGGMAQHGHGFVTQPRVTERRSTGEYQVEGMKFHMSGEWQFRVELFSDDRPRDVAHFRIQVGP